MPLIYYCYNILPLLCNDDVIKLMYILFNYLYYIIVPYMHFIKLYYTLALYHTICISYRTVLVHYDQCFPSFSYFADLFHEPFR